MQYFNQFTRFLVAGLGLILALPALAAGTNAGLLVTNAVTLDYQVNGGDQPQQADSVSFVVDRKLDLLVTTDDADWITVTIGQEYAGLSGVPALNYAVTNNSNAPIEVVVGVLEKGLEYVDGFTGFTGGETAFTSDGIIVAINTGADNTYDSADDPIILPDANGVYDITAELGSLLAEDATVNLLVVSDVSDSATAGEFASFTLVAAVAEGNAVIQLDDSGNVTAGLDPLTDGVNNLNDLAAEEIVFADTASGVPGDDGFNFLTGSASLLPDANSDGQSADSSGFLVTGVDVLVAKYAEVIYDPIVKNRYQPDGVTLTGAEPKAIPGAVIMYVIGVANQDDDFTAEAINLEDDVPEGPGPLELVNEGDFSLAADTVVYPLNVTVDYDPLNAGVNTEVFSIPPGLDLNEINWADCLGVPAAATPFVADPGPEVVVSVGSCGPNSSAYVVYFVTVEASG